MSTLAASVTKQVVLYGQTLSNVSGELKGKQHKIHREKEAAFLDSLFYSLLSNFGVNLK
jgi:spore coat protein CotH